MGQHRNPHVTPDQPHSVAAAISPNDTNNLTDFTWGLYVGGGGDVKVDMVESGTGITFKGMLAGTIYQLQVKKVYSTGTTATNLIGLY